MATNNRNTRNSNASKSDLEKIYRIADSLYEAYAADFEDMDLEKGSKQRNVLYGVLMNTVNSAGKTLQEVLGEDNASHASNLAIQRIAGEVKSFTKKVVDF